MRRATKKIKKVVSVDPHTEEIKRYVGALSEDFQHKVSAIAEQFLGFNEKIDVGLGTVSKKLDMHTEMIGRLMIDVEEIKVNMHEKVSRDEFNKLETRLVTLESFVFSGRAKPIQKPKSRK